MKHIVLSINGKKVSCPAGASVLNAAEQNGIKIPTICHHPELKPHGACRLCLVEDEKSGRLMASCVTPAAQDMAVATHTERVVAHRKNIVRLMMAEHPESCIVCNKGNRCELRKIAAELGIGEPQLYPMPNYKPFETINPFIVRDLSKCILCGRCIRADHELVAVGAIDYSDRGFTSRPTTLHDQPLEASSCTFCGTCVSMCPTGALSPKQTEFVGTAEKTANSICGFCGAGCSLAFGTAGDRVVEVNPSGLSDSVNGSTLCVRGHFAHDFLNAADRLTQPYVKTAGQTEDGPEVADFTPATWDTAIATVGSRLADIKRRYGPDSIAFIGSSKCTNEENYLFQKIARVIFETNNVANGAELNGQALLRRIDDACMGACRRTPLASLENADAIIAVNADPEHTVPVAGYHIKQAAMAKTPLVVINAARSDLITFAGAWLRPESGHPNPAWAVDAVNAISAALIDRQAEDGDFIAQNTEGLDAFSGTLQNIGADGLAGQSGVSARRFQKAVDLLGHKKIAFVLPADLLEQSHGAEIFDAVFNLALLTGSIGAENAGFFVLMPENNTAGALDMGSAGDVLPGRRKVSDEQHRQAVEQAWQTRLPAGPGAGLAEAIEAAEAGEIKAAYIMGENLLRALPDKKRVAAALENLEFLVVQDVVFNSTAQLADIILCGATFAEKNGAFTNMEGRIQTFSPVVPPPAHALPDWAILGMLARHMGYPEQYTTIEKIRQEIRRVVPMYKAFGSHRYAWVNSETQTAPEGARFAFRPPEQPDSAPPDSKFAYHAHIGTRRWHLGGGTRTSRSRRIKESGINGEIEISPADARTLALSEDDLLRLTSATGAVERPWVINRGLSAGHLFVPTGFWGNDAMALTDLSQLRSPDAGWRTCPVHIETRKA
ncbi:MAG: molybdopterin-dependent oxidoreductase [Thermodesulfobacteriota bacterium]